MKPAYKWWYAALFASFCDLLVLLFGWFLVGPPASTGSINTFKTTATIGLPTVSQLLDPRHQTMLTQATGFHPMVLFVALLLMLVYVLTNVYYIGLLSRSVREQIGTPSADVRQGWLPVLLFMLVQFVLSIIVTMPLMTLGVFGGVLAIVLLLWFRYRYFLFEYVVIILNRPFAEAWKVAPLYLKESGGRMLSFFIGILAINALLVYVVNLMFSLPVLLLCIFVNAFVHSKIQAHILRSFFDVHDRKSA